MAGMAVDGLISGINTTEMINQLMTLEAAPQTLLKGKVTKAESFVSAMQALNTKVASLKDAAATAAKAASWQAATAASTTSSVTASASGTALASSLSFSVDQVAARQTSLSGAAADLSAFFDGAAVPASLTVVTGEGSTATFATIDLTGVTDFAGFATAVNKADAGVSATLVNIGDGTTRLQLTGKGTGAAAAFDVFAGQVTSGTLTGQVPLMGRSTVADGASGPGNTVVSAAKDAVITLWKGIAGAEQAVTSATNTFADVVAGVSFTVSRVETDPVTVTVARDDAALKKLGSDLVSNLSTVLSEIASRTKPSTTTSDGRQVTSGGVLSADSATRQAKQSILSAATMPVGGASPATVGFVLGKDGTVTFDEARFSAAMAADPTGTQNIVTAIAGRIEAAATTLSDPTTGTLSLKVQGQQSFVKNLNDQVESWDTRLALRRTALERTYTALEVSLSGINAQANWLTSQLESLKASSN